MTEMLTGLLAAFSGLANMTISPDQTVLFDFGFNC